MKNFLLSFISRSLLPYQFFDTAGSQSVVQHSSDVQRTVVVTDAAALSREGIVVGPPFHLPSGAEVL